MNILLLLLIFPILGIGAVLFVFVRELGIKKKLHEHKRQPKVSLGKGLHLHSRCHWGDKKFHVENLAYNSLT